MIRLLIVEDNELFLKGLISYLEMYDDIKIVGIANTKESAIKLTKEEVPDIILMDINLTENKLDGIEAVFEIKEFIKTKVIVMTSLDADENLILDVFTSGAIEFVKKEEYKKLPDTIRKVYSEKKSPREILIKDYERLKRMEVESCLSNAEKSVIEVAEECSCSSKKIAEKMILSELTIKKHITHILDKLKVRSLREAVKKRRQKGIFYTNNF